MSPYSFALGKTPSALVRIIDCIQPARYSESLAEGRFTLAEMVAHLADFEIVFLDRMVLAVESPGTAVENIDESLRAVEKHYETRDLHHELEVFENRRRDTTEFLATLSPEGWKKQIIHPTHGPLTIDDQVAILLGHDIYHLEQASQYLR